MFDQLKCTAESCQKINKICLGIPEYLHDILQNDKELFLCCETLFHLMNEVGKRYFCLKSSKISQFLVILQIHDEGWEGGKEMMKLFLGQ